jgi:hypothetical protein
MKHDSCAGAVDEPVAIDMKGKRARFRVREGRQADRWSERRRSRGVAGIRSRVDRGGAHVECDGQDGEHRDHHDRRRGGDRAERTVPHKDRA